MAGPSIAGDGAASQTAAAAPDEAEPDSASVPYQGAHIDRSYEDVLAALPDHVALRLRDRIKGLEAEAGSARATADEVERERRADVARLTLIIEGLRVDLEQARGEREPMTTADPDPRDAEITALRGQVADLQTQLEAVAERLSAAEAGESPWARLLRHR
jgi:chromosome segregation ATPase